MFTIVKLLGQFTAKRFSAAKTYKQLGLCAIWDFKPFYNPTKY